DVPTVSESGIANFEISSWNGLFAPAHTPPAAGERLSRELALALAEPALVQRYLELGVEARALPPPIIAARMRTEIERWSRVIEDAGIERQLAGTDETCKSDASGGHCHGRIAPVICRFRISAEISVAANPGDAAVRRGLGLRRHPPPS